MILAPVGIGAFLLPGSITVRTMYAAPSAPSDTLYLGGVLRDFKSSHSDFGITDSAVMGHYSNLVESTLAVDGRPKHSATGKDVMIEWYDDDGNPIAPYESDELGLAGGHFDVDVYEGADQDKIYHKHEFDDSYDVTYVEIINFSDFEWEDVVGPSYPNPLRLELLNEHNGDGHYNIVVDGTTTSGYTPGGLTMTFMASDVSSMTFTFTSLASLAHTSPGDVKDDPVDRADSFAIRLYDTTTDEIVYEVAVYHHGDPIDPEDDGSVATDSCGDALNDSQGVWAMDGTSGIDSIDSFDDWFHDQPGTNLSSAHSIALQKDIDGVYKYETDSFWPLDEKGFGKESATHNNLFTYSINTTFQYKACTGQFFEFESNDDAWVFIDEKLVLDLGGVNTPERQRIDLDRLGLTDGEFYPLDFFYAQRRVTTDSVFDMKTNIELVSRRPTVSTSYD